MIMKLLFKPFSVTDKTTMFFTNILSGDTGSGKSSLIMQMLYKNIVTKNEAFVFKNIYINIDGFDFTYFNELAKSNGLDIKFHWLNMHDFFAFAREERELYQKYSTDGEGVIAGRIRSEISDEFKKYFYSLVICDEADNYVGTDVDRDSKKLYTGFSNFMKFKRHHSIQLWLITQKFQNLDSSIYNNGAINRFLHVRNMFFSLGKTKVLQHWIKSDTSKSTNLDASYWYEVEDDLYSRYDVGANINTGDGAKKKFKYMLLGLLAAIIFSTWLGYKLLGQYIFDTEEVKSEPKRITLDTIKKDTSSVSQTDHFYTDNIVKCVKFNQTSNCYYEENFTSLPSDFITGLIANNISQIKVIYSHSDTTFLSVDNTGLQFIFKDLKKVKNEEN